MRRRLLFSGLVLFIAAGSARADADAFKVPFETIKTQHMVVMVKINGQGPYRLIFDTGAPVTVINNKIAKESGVVAKGKEAKAPPISLFGSMPQAMISTLEMGDLKTEKLSVMVMDHPTVALIDKLMGPVQGIVGMSLFGKYKTTIDYQAKEITFEPNDFVPPDVMKNMMSILMAPKGAKKVVAPSGQWGFSVAKEVGDDDAGVSVKSVLPGSPAEAGGLKVGDRLLTLDGRWTDTVPDCYMAASFVRAGTAAKLMVLREGKEVGLTINVAAGM